MKDFVYKTRVNRELEANWPDGFGLRLTHTSIPKNYKLLHYPIFLDRGGASAKAKPFLSVCMCYSVRCMSGTSRRNVCTECVIRASGAGLRFGIVVGPSVKVAVRR